MYTNVVSNSDITCSVLKNSLFSSLTAPILLSVACHVQDPVDGSPAVLVQRYNITEQKELELQLSLQQEALQKYVCSATSTLQLFAWYSMQL